MRSFLSLIVLLLIAVSLLGGPAISSWQQHQPSGWAIVGQTSFTGGVAQSVATDGRHLYILRQHGNQNQPIFEKFDIFPNQVVKANGFSPGNPQCPRFAFRSGTALVAASVTTRTLAEVLYVLHGRSNETTRQPIPVRKCFSRFEISTGSWVSRQDTPVEQGAGDAMVYVEQDDQRYFYALVGSQCRDTDRPPSEPNIAFLRYNLSSNQWTLLQAPSWQAADDGAALAWDGGRYIYAMHGSDCGDNPTHDFARYDLETGEWTMLSDLDSSLQVPELVDDGGSLIWDGGRFLYAIVGGGTQYFHRFDLDQQMWQQLPELPCPVGKHTGNLMVWIEGNLYVWQGGVRTWDCGGNVIMRYTP